eukprot:1429859-Pyramimonas_sp.AAC.1
MGRRASRACSARARRKGRGGGRKRTPTITRTTMRVSSEPLRRTPMWCPTVRMCGTFTGMK